MDRYIEELCHEEMYHTDGPVTRKLKKQAKRIEQLEAALRELGETFVSSLTFKVADMKHKHDMPMGREHAEEVYQELGRRIMIARVALEGTKDE